MPSKDHPLGVNHKKLENLDPSRLEGVEKGDTVWFYPRLVKYITSGMFEEYSDGKCALLVGTANYYNRREIPVERIVGYAKGREHFDLQRGIARAQLIDKESVVK